MKNIVVASHAFLLGGKFGIRSGPVQPLLDYFKDKVNFFFLIGQPPPYIEGPLAPFLFVFKNGALIEKIYLKRFKFLFDIPKNKRQVKTSLRLKLADFVSVLYFARVIKKKYLKNNPVWLFFGVESVNALAAALVRKALNIENIVYYIFDWSPRWFKNKILNVLYIWFDRHACYKSDFIWNITYSIAQARKELLGYDVKKMGKQLTVPYGMPFRKDLVREDLNEDLNTIIYSGYLSCENGAMLLPKIAVEISKLDKNIKLIVLGSGDKFEGMKEKITEYKLDNIVLYGHVNGQEEIDKILVRSQIAIAPYLDKPDSKKRYGDVIKIRNYFACGLPVVTTGIVPVAEEIDKENLGFVVDYDAAKFANACVDLLKNKNLYNEVRLNVINKAKKHNWDNIYTTALGQMSRSRSVT